MRSPGAEVPYETFAHEAFGYRGTADFVAGVGSFVRDGLERDETVVVALPRDNMRALHDELNGAAGAVQFLDMETIGANPARIIGRWQQVVDEADPARRGLRGVGEPTWPSRRPQEMQECQLHELLIDAAFENGPGWRLLCPFDAANLPGAVVDVLAQAHPLSWADATPVAQVSAAYRSSAAAEFFSSATLPDPVGPVARYEYGTPTDVCAVRKAVRAFAQGHVEGERLEDLVIAASELTTNGVSYGMGGVVELWQEPASIIMQFTDSGYIENPLVGRLPSDATSPGGRGVYLAYQLCDLVQLRSSASGTVARIHTWTS
jgi:anti-sigma regulatory factor (Ser/Thr protein kinase)